MKVLANNRKAYYEYTIEKELEAGISLQGTEVKSMKNGNVNIREAYVSIEKEEAFIIGMHVAPYDQGSIHNVDPYRKRKLLLRKREIRDLYSDVQQQGLTLIPLSVYTNDRGKIKVKIALARGKRIYDKREALKQKDDRRRMEQAIKRY